MPVTRIAAAAAAAVLALAVSAGCQSETKQTNKEQATKRWNAARASVLTSLARDQYQGGNFEKCRATISEGLKLTPESAPLRVLSAKVHVEQGQLEAAENELKLARQHAPADGEAFYLSGVIYQRWQKPEAAFEFYKGASERSPAEISYLLAQAEMLVAMDRRGEALALLTEKVNYFEHSGVIRDAVGQLLMQSGRHGDAVAMFRQACILAEDDQGVRERLGLALYHNKNYRECADVLGKLVADEAYQTRADLFTVLGESQLQLGKSRDARYSFETASTLDPYSAPIWRGLGRAALEQGDLKRAELSLTRSVKLDPAPAETHLLIGYTRLRQNRLPEALTSFQTAHATDRRDTVSLCMIGYAYAKMGRQAEALQYYGKALSIRPGDDLATQLMAGVNLND